MSSRSRSRGILKWLRPFCGHSARARPPCPELHRGRAGNRRMRRHATDGGTRTRVSGDARPGVGARRSRSHYAVGSRAEDSTYGLEHPQYSQSSSAARRNTARAAGTACIFRAFIRVENHRGRRPRGPGGLRRAAYGRRWPRQHDRDAISPGKKSAPGSRADRKFLEVEAVILFPAIDLKEGIAVRLEQGDMARATIFHRDPAAQAHAFEQQGFQYLHIVDLDGAFAGKPMNAAAVDRILETVSVPVQLGGGIRDTATVESWLDKGISRVIIGTAAVRDPPFVKQAARDFPGRIVVGLDARDGKVAVEGWAETSQLSALDIARRFEDVGVSAIIYTDISRDGMLQGLNRDATIALADEVSIPGIASGGVASIEDIKALVAPSAKKLAGAIVGRALYDGRVDAAEALNLIRTAGPTL